MEDGHLLCSALSLPDTGGDFSASIPTSGWTQLSSQGYTTGKVQFAVSPSKGKAGETGIRLFEEWEWISSQGSTEGGAQPGPGWRQRRDRKCFPAELGHPPLPPALPYTSLFRHKPLRISRHKPPRIFCSFSNCISIFKFEEEEKKPQIQRLLESSRET